MSRTYDYEFEYLFEEVEIDGHFYGVTATIGYDAETVDNGIGPYEFWGACGTDVRIETEISASGIVSIDKVVNEDDEVVDGVVTIDAINGWLASFNDTPYHDRWNPARWLDEAIESEAERELSE
tara:strand:+ start:24512 stop:24883 length:372 start_codon:yes stop_codon:yes gene_type:complete